MGDSKQETNSPALNIPLLPEILHQLLILNLIHIIITTLCDESLVSNKIILYIEPINVIIEINSLIDVDTFNNQIKE
ncbi:hypothetical protein DAPK24_035660 [Pichia kluyveri]|uniref:Uncharacterized protein n=1 Tax=Pichia kluyveri TaxID=36015 RepID=A0AAV5R8R5_PICKL|nr:hypothetical protein DAPK24_035660 [Pichia kluyveri]